MSDPGLFELDLGLDQRDADISAIHWATAIYTRTKEVEALLDRLDWPVSGRRLLDPGAGNGGFVVAALARMPLSVNDVESAVDRVRGYEFFRSAANDARRAVAGHLGLRGWNAEAARTAANHIIEERDFLLDDDIATNTFDIVATNPPYLRYANLPKGYRAEYDIKVEQYARADMLYAYLDRAAEIIAVDGRIGVITSDRWLLNNSSDKLREHIGKSFGVHDVFRLDPDSTFYRSKARTRGSLARVHPVTMVLKPGDSGRRLTREPFVIDVVTHIAGRPLTELMKVQLAPWLGPDGIFIVDNPNVFPENATVPVALPSDIDARTGELKPPTRWALVTGGNKPHPVVLAHLQRQHHKMPERGRRSAVWLPPETFSGRLPLDFDSTLIPRIARRLTAVRLPSGRLPVNHGLVLASGLSPEIAERILDDPVVQQQADALALGVDSGYNSYTATLLRRLTVPQSLINELERDGTLASPGHTSTIGL